MSVKHRLSHPIERGWGPGEGRPYPRLVIEANGIDDVYRLARVMEVAQVEFSDIGHAALVGLDRRYPGIVRALVARMGPSRWGYRGVKPRAKEESRVARADAPSPLRSAGAPGEGARLG